MAGIGDKYGVFPLGRQTAVLGDDGPIIRQQLHMAFAGIDHWFDGERHAGLQCLTGTRLSIVQDLRILVKFPANTVSAIFPHDGIMARFSVLLDGMTDVPETYPRLDHFDADFHAFIGGLDQPLRQHRWRAHEKHLAGVPMVAILDDGNIDVDNVAVLELLDARDTVADHVVDGRADGFGKSLVIQGRRDGFLGIDDIVVADAVKLIRGDPGLYVRRYQLQHVSGQAAGHAHFFNLGRGFDGHGHENDLSRYG